MTEETMKKFNELCSKLRELHEKETTAFALFYVYKLHNDKEIIEFQLWSEDDDLIEDNYFISENLDDIEIAIDNLLIDEDVTSIDDLDNPITAE